MRMAHRLGLHGIKGDIVLERGTWDYIYNSVKNSWKVFTQSDKVDNIGASVRGPSIVGVEHVFDTSVYTSTSSNVVIAARTKGTVDISQHSRVAVTYTEWDPSQEAVIELVRDHYSSTYTIQDPTKHEGITQFRLPSGSPASGRVVFDIPSADRTGNYKDRQVWVKAYRAAKGNNYKLRIVSISLIK